MTGVPTGPEFTLRLAIVAIVGVGSLMVNDRAAAFACGGLPESFTCKVKDAFEAPVGVPLIIPVAVLRLNPVGNVPAVRDQL